MSEEQVEDEVGNKVVVGYYYHQRGKSPISFEEYRERYFDAHQPLDYLRNVLASRAQLILQDDFELMGQDESDLEHISQELLHKELTRVKANWRTDIEKQERMMQDVRLGLYAARIAGGGGFTARGYVVSSDSAFTAMQNSQYWPGRGKIHLRSSSIPALAELLCGIRIPDDALVRVVFDPVHVAAAEFMKDDLQPLVEAGIILMDEPLDRLEWKVANQLHTQIDEVRKARTSGNRAERVSATLDLAAAASQAGCSLPPDLEEVVQRHKDIKQSLVQETEKRLEAEDLVEKLLAAASGLSKKGRRRVNRILREVGKVR